MDNNKRLRLIVTGVDNGIIKAHRVGDADDCVEVDSSVNRQTQQAMRFVREGMQINVLSYTEDLLGMLHPMLIVIEPDYLLNITDVTGCFKEYGDSAFNHMLAKFTPRGGTQYTLLGDFANNFLDDLMNDADADYIDSMKRAFADRVIDVSVCSEIGKGFFDECKRQFDNIKKVSDEIRNKYVSDESQCSIELEPSFFCEALGIQGRMDCLMQMGAENFFLIELKSGKWNEYYHKAKDEHLMQMLLYKEIMYYNLGVEHDKVKGNLLYSKYPELQQQGASHDYVLKAMTMRNNIVALEMGMRDGDTRKWLDALTPDKLRRGNVNENFWTKWCLPKIKDTLDVLHSMDELTREYFHVFLQFLVREQFETKVGAPHGDYSHCMASLWNVPEDEKVAEGDIFINLKVVDVRENDGIEALCLESDADYENQPNFRVGDGIILYERTQDGDNVTNKRLVRCAVESYDNGKVWLLLKNRQRNRHLLEKGLLFAIEHDYVDSLFNALYSGLFLLAAADERRRDLLLCQRAPEHDCNVVLNGKYLNAQIEDLVLRVKSAKDMFLLMGPPGTGKTSVALKSMVEEFLSEGKEILLLSYTNRAVDEICAMLESIDHAPDYVRIGRKMSCAEDFHEHVAEERLGKLDNRKQVLESIRNCHVFVSTVSSMNSHANIFDVKSFDVAIFDEASQILEPQVLGLLSRENAIKKFVMIGDHKQLPAVSVLDDEVSDVRNELLKSIGLTNCKNSLFQRLYERYKDDPSVVGMLDHQGRMHPEICDFASEMFYEGKLKSVLIGHQVEELPFVNRKENGGNELAFNTNEESKAEIIVVAGNKDVNTAAGNKYDINKEEGHGSACVASGLMETISSKRFVFMDVPLPNEGERMLKANVREARMIAELVKGFVILHKENDLPFTPEKQIGIIVPFRRQIAMVRRELERLGIDGVGGIAVDTVERYQGSQRDIIIYGTTVTEPFELDILSNIVKYGEEEVDRKLNVAITRARKQLFVLGNKELLKTNSVYSRLIEYAEEF